MNLFTYLMSKNDKNYVGNDNLFSFLLGKNQRSSLLPKEYKQVHYLESTGTQYIDTGVIIDNNIGYELTLQYLDAGGMFGRYSSSRLRIVGQYNKTNGYVTFLRWIYGATEEASTYRLTDSNIYLNKTTYALKNRRDLYINGELTYHFTTTLTTGNQDETFLLFAQSTVKGIGRIYRAKLYHNNGTTDVLTHDYIPCYRKADRKPGFYDIVTNTFFTNDGEGEFLYK